MALERPVLDSGSPPSDTASLPERLVALTGLTLPELRAEWRRLYRSQAPRLSRNLMVRAIAWRLQERTCGGVSAAVSRKLLEYGRRDAKTPQGRDVTNALPKPGTRLVREWNGRTYTVTITEDGYAYNGSSYSSLTRIARVITGAHWSGPRFFGLNGKKTGSRTGVDDGEPNA